MRMGLRGAVLLLAVLCLTTPLVLTIAAEDWADGFYDDESNDLVQLDTLTLALIPAVPVLARVVLTLVFVLPSWAPTPLMLPLLRAADTRAPPTAAVLVTA